MSGGVDEIESYDSFVTNVIVGGGGSGTPTAVLKDPVGLADALVLSNKLPDDQGYADALGALTIMPTDASGFSDAVASVTFNAKPTDASGFSDSIVAEFQESAQNASGTPDNDAWGDGWVDRTVTQAGTHQPNGTTATFAAVTVATEMDAYTEINFNRFVSFTGNAAGTSTITFTVTWPTVTLSPTATVHVDLQVSAGKPFVESTFTANTTPRFSSSAPFSQRSFTFAQDGTVRTHVITLTTAEVNAILGGKWLELQFTVPDLTAGTPFLLHARRAHDATVVKYDLFALR